MKSRHTAKDTTRGAVSHYPQVFLCSSRGHLSSAVSAPSLESLLAGWLPGHSGLRSCLGLADGLDRDWRSSRICNTALRGVVCTEHKDAQQRAIVGQRRLSRGLHPPRYLEVSTPAQSPPSLEPCVFGCGEKLCLL